MYRKTGDQYFDSKEFRELLSKYEKSVEDSFPVFMDVDELTDIADYYHLIGREEDADTLIEKTLELHPLSMGPLIYKIHQALDEGQCEKAREIANKIVDKDCLDYLYIVGEILLAEQKTHQAEKLFQRQLAHIGLDEYNEYVLDVANIFADYSQYDKAMAWMMRSDMKKTPELMELTAQILLGLGNYQESERILNELIDIDPYSVQYWNSLGNAQYMQKKYDDAITSSEFAMAIDPNETDSLFLKATCLCLKGCFQEAEKLFKKIILKNPKDIQALLSYGTCLIKTGKKEEGISVLEELLEELPKSSPLLVECYEELAFAYSDLHMPETAIYYLDKTDELECDHIDMKVVKGHVLLANEQFEKAEIKFREAIIESNSDPKIFLRIIISAYDNHYVKATYHMLSNYLSSYGDRVIDGYAYMTLCCWDLKKYDECIDYLKKAITINPDEARQVLSDLFPPELELKDYNSYLLNKIKELNS